MRFASQKRSPRLVMERLESRATPTAGLFDPTFGAGGRTTVGHGVWAESWRDLVVQADGKILLSGVSRNGNGLSAMAVLRVNADGTPDATFGNAGRVVIDLTGSDRDSGAVADLASGRTAGSSSRTRSAGRAWASRPSSN